MYYEVYIDVLFFWNFILDYFLLLFVWKLMKCSTTQRRILAGAGVGAGMTCIVVLLPLPYSIMKFALFHVVVNTITIKTAYKIQNRTLFWEILGMLYFSTFLLGGIMNWIQNSIQQETMMKGTLLGEALFSAILGWSILRKIGRFIAHMQKNRKSKCRVVLSTSTGKYELQALLDTGNELVDSLSGKCVNVIDRMLACEIFSDQEMNTIRYVPYRSIGREGILPAVRIQEMTIYLVQMYTINQNQERTYCVKEPIIGISEREISTKKAYQIILNPDVLGGNEDVSEGGSAKSVSIKSSTKL